MSFLDKFFSHKNRNNQNENPLKTQKEFLSFRSSHLDLSKDRIRFILFRECDRRGRKLLFDSNAVEKLPLFSKGILDSQKFHNQNNEKIIEFIETTSTHGYKYKKPSSDVAFLGEMIFGSVAMIYKGENSCKIHSIPSPKQLMFTTIIHAPSRCPLNTTSKLSLEDNSKASSLASFNEIISQKQPSSSDSKLYKKEIVAQKYSLTYPWIKNSPLNKINQCCEISDLDSNLSKKSFLLKDNEVKYLENVCLNNKNNRLKACNLNLQENCVDEVSSSCENNLNQRLKNFDIEKDCINDFDNAMDSENVSSTSDSLGSLRRRWIQSYTTSLESITFEDNNSSPSKKRTKLGMALVLDLSNTLEEEMEKFLFNHTIVIDIIMNKLKSSVELAYIRNENFVDLIFTAFQNSQHSLHELITGRKYETPICCMLIGNSDEDLEYPLKGNSFCDDIRTVKKKSLLGSLQLKFLNDFCDILVKFDTKDTNFFISTLLTAVLTHHLSWATSIAEANISTPNKKLSVIKNILPYNPLWAQINDLYGLLGSPLKCAKTIITGAESKKCHIAGILQILTYFIRCNNVMENYYDIEIEDVVGKADLEGKKFMESFDSDVDSSGHDSFTAGTKKSEKKHFTCIEKHKSPTENVTIEKQIIKSKENKETFSKKENSKINKEIAVGLKRNKSNLSDIKIEDSLCSGKLYPDIKDLAKSENVNVADLDYEENDRTFFVEKLINSKSFTEKIKKMIRVPTTNINPHLEGYLSPDEGYDTIDSKTEDICVEKMEIERQYSSCCGQKENIVFVLGENDKLVNVQKKVLVTKSSVIDMEKESSRNISNGCELMISNSFEPLNASLNSERDCEKKNRTSQNFNNKSCLNYSENKNEHSFNQLKDQRNASWKIPWMVRELDLPRATKPSHTRRLEVSSVLGSVNQQYNSEQVIQGVLSPKINWELTLQKDLFLCAHNSILEKDVNEALCIVGDMDSWEVSIFSSSTSILDRIKHAGVRVGMSQLVADMLESFLYLHTINLSPNFCLLHIERKLHEIYLKSQTVAELLNSTDLCSIDYLTTRLNIGVNDVPLLLSVATTHSPHISEKYGLSFT